MFFDLREATLTQGCKSILKIVFCETFVSNSSSRQRLGKRLSEPGVSVLCSQSQVARAKVRTSILDNRQLVLVSALPRRLDPSPRTMLRNMQGTSLKEHKVILLMTRTMSTDQQHMTCTHSFSKRLHLDKDVP